MFCSPGDARWGIEVVVGSEARDEDGLGSVKGLSDSGIVDADHTGDLGCDVQGYGGLV